MKILILFVFGFLSISSINAEIVYTDFNPDIVLKGSLSNPWSQFNIDLDNDASPDFTITHFYPSDDLFYVEMSCSQYKDNEILVDESQTPKSLSMNDEINSEQSVWYNSNSIALHVRNNWVGAKDKYLGLRIKKQGKWYYGWVRMEIPLDESNCTIKDFAYETLADKGLKAGEGITSVQYELNNNSTLIFPNPVTSKFNIKGHQQRQKLSIINIFGQVLFEKKESFLEESIDISCLSNGIYFLKIGDEVLKFVVNK
jgi:hypothetical protein